MKKFLSILLSVAMLMTILPAAMGFAETPAKYSVKMVDNTKGDVMPGDMLTFTWTFAGGYDFMSGFNFVVDYDDDYLTPVQNATYPGGKILKPACEVVNSQIKGTAVAGDNVWTKEGVEDEDTGDISEKNLALLQVRFTVNGDVPANTESAVVLNITSYCVWDDVKGAVEYPVEVAQIPAFVINPQEIVEQSSDATLKSLAYGETAIELVAGQYTYDVELPYGVEAPALTAVANDAKASVAVEGNTVVVTAEDGTKATYTVNFTNAAPAVTGIKADKAAIEVPYANRDAVADYVKAHVAVNYVTEAGDGEAVEVFEVAAAEGTATITVGEYTTTVAYTVADPLVTGIEADKAAIEVPYANKDAVAEYIKENIAVNYVTEAGKGEAVEAFEVVAAEGNATITVGEYTATVEYTVADPLVVGIKADKASIEVPYDNKDAVADYIKAHVAVNYVTEAGDGEAVEAFEVAAADGIATITVGEYATTVEYTIAEKLYKLTVAAANGTVEADGEDWGAYKTADFTTGAKVTLKAVAEEGFEFAYWMDATTKRVVYYDAEYPVTMGTDKSVVAVFTAVAEDVFTVEFIGFNNKVYTYAASNMDITVPANPYVLGYTFEGWKIGGALTEYKAGDVIAAGTFTADAKLVASQKLDETAYTVTLIGANEEGGEYQYNKLIAVTPAVTEGKVFAYWTRDGKIVSYDANYSFFVANADTTVEAVFADEAVEAAATIAMAVPTIVAGNKISFLMERNVPAGYSVVETGIILKKGIVDEITLDNYELKGTSSNTAAYGAYTVRKANVAAGESWSAVGYLIYTDGAEVYTIYTDVVSATL